mmetsp:Transcript_17501/g.28319  ORF Transcript_17501/g.28319 Transcript_17501/m.28319 type:complete len:91 (+) Transcript_17501:44-316(+)
MKPEQDDWSNWVADCGSQLSKASPRESYAIRHEAHLKQYRTEPSLATEYMKQPPLQKQEKERTGQDNTKPPRKSFLSKALRNISSMRRLS